MLAYDVAELLVEGQLERHAWTVAPGPSNGCYIWLPAPHKTKPNLPQISYRACRTFTAHGILDIRCVW